MGGDEEVDFLQAGGFGGDLVDAAGIARAGVAGVDEDGFAGGRDNEGGAAAFGINPVDVEGARRGAQAGREEECDEEGEGVEEVWFHKKGRDGREAARESSRGDWEIGDFRFQMAEEGGEAQSSKNKAQGKDQGGKFQAGENGLVERELGAWQGHVRGWLPEIF